MSKLTVKQERFCLAYLKTGNASEAYRQAYDAENMSPEALHVAACRLLKNPNVTLRVQGIQAKVAAKAELTALDILEELREARDLALKLEQPAAAVSASMGRAKVAGLVVDKKEVGGVGEFQRASDADLDEFITSEAKELVGTPKRNGRAH